MFKWSGSLNSSIRFFLGPAAIELITTVSPEVVNFKNVSETTVYFAEGTNQACFGIQFRSRFIGLHIADHANRKPDRAGLKHENYCYFFAQTVSFHTLNKKQQEKFG